MRDVALEQRIRTPDQDIRTIIGALEFEGLIDEATTSVLERALERAERVGAWRDSGSGAEPGGDAPDCCSVPRGMGGEAVAGGVEADQAIVGTQRLLSLPPVCSLCL